MHNKRSTNGQKAFTLIELLVVVAIIGLLSSVVMYSVTGAREKAFDTKRVQDLRQLQIAAEIRLLENVAIPTVSAIGSDQQFASGDAKSGGAKASIGTAIKYLTMTPNEAEASLALYNASAAYYDALFSNGFFKPGATKPQDPQCVAGQPNTCYRAYYDTASNVLVIATTLRTKKHTTGIAPNVQYGIAVGKGVSNPSIFAATCQAIGFPVFSTAQTATNIASCADAGGISSIIQGVSTGRNIGGATSIGSI